MTSNFTDPTEHGGPAGLMREMQKKPQKYGGIRPLPERGKGSETRIAGRDDIDLNELYRRFGYSMPIAQLAESANKYGGHMKDANVTELDEKAAILDALAIHRMIITSECVQRKARYEAEEREAQRWLNAMAADRRPKAFHFDPYLVVNDSAEDSILQDYLDSVEEDQLALEAAEELEEGDEEEEEPEVDVIIPEQRRRGRPPKEESEPPKVRIPLVEELVNKWGACDAYMFQVLLDEERHGIDYAEQHYDRYERIERVRRDTEFLASVLPPAENAYFWCRIRQMGIIRERSYDVAMGFPIHDFSDVLEQINQGKNIHDLAHLLDWSFDNAYRRITGSMLEGTEFRTTLTAMIAQQVPLSPQLLQAMQAPPGAFWQGQPWAQQQPGQETPGEEQAPDKRGAIFNFVKRNSGAQPQQQPSKKTRRRGRNGNA